MEKLEFWRFAGDTALYGFSEPWGKWPGIPELLFILSDLSFSDIPPTAISPK